MPDKNQVSPFEVAGSILGLPPNIKLSDPDFADALRRGHYPFPVADGLVEVAPTAQEKSLVQPEVVGLTLSEHELFIQARYGTIRNPPAS